MGSEPTNDVTPGESHDKLDLLPEYYHYRDEGCEFATSCLNCPFAKCIYEQPGGRQCWLKGQRDREMVRLFKTEGKEVRELAQIFGVSQRTVQRALRNSLPVTSPSSSRRGGEIEKGD